VRDTRQRALATNSVAKLRKFALIYQQKFQSFHFICAHFFLQKDDLMADPAPSLDIPADLIRFERPLFHLARQLQAGRSINIVAIGFFIDGGRKKEIPPYPGRLKRPCGPGSKPAITVLNGSWRQEALEECCASIPTFLPRRRH